MKKSLGLNENENRLSLSTLMSLTGLSLTKASLMWRRRINVLQKQNMDVSLVLLMTGLQRARSIELQWSYMRLFSLNVIIPVETHPPWLSVTFQMRTDLHFCITEVVLGCSRPEKTYGNIQTWQRWEKMVFCVFPLTCSWLGLLWVKIWICVCVCVFL